MGIEHPSFRSCAILIQLDLVLPIHKYVQILRANGKHPFPVKDTQAAITAAESISGGRLTPVFTLSTVSGKVACVVCDVWRMVYGVW